MQIYVNGESQEVEDGLTVAGLVQSLAADPRGIAIERNREIVPKAEHASTLLRPGDELEVVQFVGGG